MSDYLRRYEILTIISAIIMGIIGCLMIVAPVKMLNTIIIIFTIGLLIKGIVDLLSYIFMPNEMRRYSNGLLEGVLCILSGVLIYLNMDFFKDFMPIVLGIYVVFESIMKMQISFLFLSGLTGSSWLFVFLQSILGILLGFLLIVYPSNAIISVTMATGIVLVISAILEIIETIVMMKKIKYFSIY